MSRNSLHGNVRAFRALPMIWAGIFCFVLPFAMGACASPGSTPYPTYTPLPTYIPYSTYTPYPTYTPQLIVAIVPTSTVVLASPTSKTRETSPTVFSMRTPTLTALCIPYTEARLHGSEMICVRGRVASTFKSSNAFFIDFDTSPTSFYAVSFEYTWDNLKGQCVEITGKVEDYRGRPQIVISKKDQLRSCSSPQK